MSNQRDQGPKKNSSAKLLTGDDLLPIQIASLQGDLPVSFDLYVQVAGKYVLYMRNGETLDAGRLSRLHERKVEQMFIQIAHGVAFQKYIEEGAHSEIVRQKTDTPECRAANAIAAQQELSEAVMRDLQDALAYENAQAGSDRFVELLQTDQEALALMLKYPNIDKRLSVHGVAVATLCVGMARKLGMTDRNEFRVIALGALLHDVGHLDNGVSYRQPVMKMDSEMRKNYKKHPVEAALKSKFVPHFDPVVTRIILEHEELADGTGFPNKLKQSDMHPFSLLVSTANAYDRLVSFEFLKPDDALRRLIVDRNGKYTTESINALKSVLKDSEII